MKEEVFANLDKWVSDKGNSGYIENSYNPYFCVDNHYLNEEFAIQQSKEEISEFVDVILKNCELNSCLEIGLGHYGSTHFLWRQIFDKVVTIEKNFERIREFGRNTKKFYDKWVLDDGHSQFFNGYSNDEKVISEVYAKVPNVDFLFIDGNHSYDSVLCDFLLYYPIVKKGGLIGFHDTKLSENNIGVPKLISEIRDGKFTNGSRILINDIFHTNYLGISYFIK
jgi:cephalosporin hydroxylase